MTNNSSNQKFTNNSDGFTIGGGTTERDLTLSSGNITLSGGGSNTYTFPGSTDTLVGRASTDTLTNKTITDSSNSVGPAARTGGFAIGSFTPTGTGNYSVTGVGFTPKLVCFMSLDSNTTSTASKSSGYMTSSAQFWEGMAVGTSKGRQSSTSNCYGEVSGGSGSVYTQASYVSLDTDGFTINFGTVGASPANVGWIAYA